ncbi:squalene/phytoene synthase family protein [Robbsia sp. Bb-Pol-6]|uniref:Squalene/phytoene synthase family protein n=1 Tax=Robbsia betulipollinis TaxID=2981849 RepID=A0ABT3ZP15_9BURK|nr:squalene/phytoene synthase family protein [Robbsia betulipollinis]
MKPLDYCQQKAAPPGSTLYYALQQARPARRPALTALHAYRRELADTVLESSDPSIAQAKLDWWRRETLSLSQGAPSHPVSHALAATLPRLCQAPAPLFALIDGFEQDLRQARYLDLTGLKNYLAVVSGDFTEQIARASRRNDATAAVVPSERDAAAPAPTKDAPSAARAPSWAHRLGVALSFASIIADLGADARHGRIYLPISEMQQFGVSAADILNRRYSTAFTALMAFQTARARSELHASLDAIPRAERRSQASLRAQAAMALRLLAEIEASGFQVLHQRIALTPVRNLLVAWWAARR